MKEQAEGPVQYCWDVPGSKIEPLGLQFCFERNLGMFLEEATISQLY